MVPEDGSSSASPSSLQMLSLWPGCLERSPNCYPQPREMKSEERGLCLIHLLIACANHVASNNLENANSSLDYISCLASLTGDTMQRISAHFAEALADRMLRGWPGLHWALTSAQIISLEEEILARKLFFDFCPFLKLSYAITNQAILEAMEGERVVHVVDLDCFEPAQWVGLIQALSARPEGPPHLRMTGLHENKGVLDRVARRLNEEAEKLDIPFQFTSVVCKLEALDFDSLHVKSGEAVAVSSVLRLHSLLAADDAQKPLGERPNAIHLQKMLHLNPLHLNPLSLGHFLEKDANGTLMGSTPKLTSFLNSLWSLSPKIVMVTEQESNHNSPNLMDRIMEALNFYAALFDCLESTLPAESLERQKIEKMLYGREINNIVSCEGVDRKVRHEKLEKWVGRLELVGFGKLPLSYHVMLQARKLLQSFNFDGYRVREENGYLLICWHDQPLFSVSAWRSRRKYS